MIEHTHDELLKSGPRRISPFFIPSTIINMIAGNLSIMLGTKGPNLAIVTACTTSTHCIGEAAKSIRYGEVEVMIAGGAESCVTELALGGFAAARACRRATTRRKPPAVPGTRTGMVSSSAKAPARWCSKSTSMPRARGARIYCELAGYGVSSDAYHMTAPAEDGDGAFRCMRNALRDAGLNVEAIDYINAHGTSTPLGDLAETMAVKKLLGDRAKRVAVNSTKSMTGHLLGAAGGIEAIASVLALRDQVSPPTINLDTPDPQCDLDYVPNTARKMAIRTALSNSFGFGGTNGTLIFTRL